MALIEHTPTPAPRAPSSRAPAAHTVPQSIVAQLVELVARWHVSPGELFAGTGVSTALLEDPLGRVDVDTRHALHERARRLTGEPGLGYYLGLQKRVSIYGYLGFAAGSAASLRDALGIAIRFAPVFSTAIGIELREEGGVASLCLVENTDLGSVRDIVLISLVFGLETIGRALSGREPTGPAQLAMDFAFPEPEYQPRFRHLVPLARFGQPFTRVSFDAATLDLPVVTADRTALQLSRALCERALDEIDPDAGLVDRVRGQMWSEGGFRSLQIVAERLGVSPRTLKRRLAARDVSFSELVERERRERALMLLRSPMSIDQVAERLEYSTASTFVRAFHRWTGTTPAVYRRASRRP
jgi:AraC-like DNA-binding protein